MQTSLCSVIIPVYNGAATIIPCLDGLARQTLPPHCYEIIVVDDGSQDNTATVIQQWIDEHDELRAWLIQQSNAGPAAARNHGAQAAQSELLFFIDADCVPAEDWIESMCRPFGVQWDSTNGFVKEEQETPVMGAKGIYISTQTGVVPRFVQAEYEDRYDRMRSLPQIDFIDTYSAGYRRDLFLQNDGFDPVFTTASVEDQEFSFRLAQKGYRMVFEPSAKVAHTHDLNVAEYWWRKYYIGYWKALLTRWHPERMVQDSHTPQVLKIQMGLWALIIGLIPLAFVGFVWPLLKWIWPLIGILLLLFLGTTVPFVRKLAKRSPQLAMLGPALIAVRSVALGVGYLHGTIHFAGAIHGMRQPVIPGWKRIVKRAIDIAIALVGLIVSLPLILIAAAAIKLDTDGPILFRQQRVGEHGVPFTMLKLRSMVHDAEEKLSELVNLEELDEPVYKIVDDPRVTRVGRILRQTSLDETPQFVNVLRGEMSLVGPRPEESRLVALYNDHQRRRLHVKPGITGPMQVHGRGALTLAERLKLEQDYIDNYSLSRDFKLIWATFPAILRGDGAY